MSEIQEKYFVITNEVLVGCIKQIAFLLTHGFQSFQKLDLLYLNHYALKNIKFDKEFVEKVKAITMKNIKDIEKKPFDVFSYFLITSFSMVEKAQCEKLLDYFLNNPVEEDSDDEDFLELIEEPSGMGQDSQDQRLEQRQQMLKKLMQSTDNIFNHCKDIVSRADCLRANSCSCSDVACAASRGSKGYCVL